jgi:hypothetical protein
MRTARLLMLSGCTAGLFFSLATSLSAQVHATADRGKAPENPALVDHYQLNKEEISALMQNVKNPERSEENRLNDFKKLRSKYHDYAIEASATLIKDKSTPIALLAVKLLGGASAMTDHRMDSKYMSPSQKYAMAMSEFVRKALREAQADERQEIRDWATQSLASLSDEVGLDNIVKGAADGRYSEIDTINHLSLARPEASDKLLYPYLKKATTADAKAAVVSILSNSRKYANEMRDNYLLNEDAPLVTRLAAAKNLAKDPRSLLLLSNPKTPAELIEQVCVTYLDENQSKISAAELKVIKDAVTGFSKTSTGHDLKPLLKKIETMQQEKSP